jgi:hypothetical protein
MMRIYYLSSAEYALSNIALQRIKISRFSDLNDPFELLPLDLSDHDHRDVIRNTKLIINETKGLICFSKSWKNPVLWGHYADKHRGIALGFDVPEDILQEVFYAQEPSKIEFEEIDGKMSVKPAVIKCLMSTKFADWKYEDEMRLFVSLDPTTRENGLHFLDFSEELQLREVILGSNCELPINAIQKLVSNVMPEIAVIKARIAFETFSVVADVNKTT